MSDKNFNEDYQEWLEALENVIVADGSDHAKDLLNKIFTEAKFKGIHLDGLLDPPFKNTVPSDQELAYPGDWNKEEQIRHLIRWNSLVMVLKANRDLDLGGHISTYASACTLYEVGMNHFFRGSDR